MAKQETHTSENAKLYELGFHLLPTIAEDKVIDAFSNVTGIISEKGGKVIKSGEPKAIKLAYTITKKINTQNERFKTAYFAWVKFVASSKEVAEIKNAADANSDILRYILVKTVDDDEKSTIKLVKEEKDYNGLESADDSEMTSEEVISTQDDSEEKSFEIEAEEVASDEVVADESNEDASEKVTEKSEEVEESAEVKTADSQAKTESDEIKKEEKRNIDKIDEVLDEMIG